MIILKEITDCANYVTKNAVESEYHFLGVAHVTIVSDQNIEANVLMAKLCKSFIH
jgi:hypothetical protein